MRIAFVWDWPPEPSQTMTWQDGLAAAIKELKTRHDVIVLMPDDHDWIIHHPYFDILVAADIKNAVRGWKPDVVLFWGDMTRPNAPLVAGDFPTAICFAGGDVMGENSLLFDHIFVESQIYLDRLENAGYDNVSIAFGTNTDLFKPVEQNKAFHTIFPATFALWKRHNLYAKATEGLRSLACGYMYETHEQECWQDCLKAGVTILPHTSASVLRYLYAASRICVVPSRSDGGSQRTVLEAMAMNLPVIVCDSDKFDFAKGMVYRAEPTVESIRGHIDALLDGEPDCSTREYIVKKWSHIQYAKALEVGLEKIR